MKIVEPDRIEERIKQSKWYGNEEVISDVGKLIRCKDCIYYHKPEIGFTTGDCTYRTAWYPVGKEEFCSLAKSKDGEQE